MKIYIIKHLREEIDHIHQIYSNLNVHDYMMLYQAVYTHK